MPVAWRCDLQRSSEPSGVSLFNVTVYPLSLNLLYTSYIWTGLFDLEAEGRLEVSISLRPRPGLREVNGSYRQASGQCVFCMRVEDSVTRESRVIHVDLMDDQGIASAGGLEACDVYFKRS